MKFYIAHEIPGRIRLRPSRPGFKKDLLSEKLSLIDGIQKVAFNPKTGNTLIVYCLPGVRTTILSFLTTQDALAFCPQYLDGVQQIATNLVCIGKGSREGGVKNPIPGFVFRLFLPMPARIFWAVSNSIPYLWNGAKALVQKRRLDLETLDATALAVCLLRRDFLSAGMISFFFALGDYLDDWTRKKSHASLGKSLALNIEHVWIRHDGIEQEILMRDVRSGDHIVVRAGSVIPVDGTVLEGEAMVNQSSMTGEPLPVLRGVGSSVYAGTVLAEGKLLINATKVGDEMRIASIVRFIAESEERKAAIETRYERIADKIVPYNFLLAFVVLLLTRNLARAGSVLLVDYSCAIRLATPLVVLSAMRESARHGVLIKGGKFMEALAQVDTVVFDKTGTLTRAQPVLVEVIAFGRYRRNTVLKLAACLEEHFVHPVGQAIVRAAEEEGLKHREEHAEVEFIVAHGISSSLRGKRVLIGSEHFVIEDEATSITEEQREIVRQQASMGRSVLFLAIGGVLAGVLMVEDEIRDEAVEVVSRLRANGIKRIVMLTGDGELTAQEVAAKAGITEFRARMLPEDKARYIEQMKQEGNKVLMVGDGMNDSPALSAANVGMAMVDGADIAREIADVVLTRGQLQDILHAREISKRAMARIRNNFAASVTLNTAFLGGNLSNLLTPMTSAVLHNITTIGVSFASMHPLLVTRPDEDDNAALLAAGENV